MTTKILKFPKSIGACVDRLYSLREKRLKIQQEVDSIKSQEEALRLHVLECFNKDDIEGAKGKLATASVLPKTVAHVVDWDALYAYIVKNNAFEMLQRRVNDGAYRERLDNKEPVPGVEPFNVLGLSLTKSKK